MTNITRAPIVSTSDCRQLRCLHLDITDQEAWAFAQCLKRAGFWCYQQLAINDEEAYLMQSVAEQLRAAFVAVGFAPR